jgi:hypothetical protein
MKTIETTAVVGDDRKLTVRLPADITPGEHRVVVLIDNEPTPAPTPPEWRFPVIDVGPWPEGFTVRREDIYGDDGR